MYSQNTSANSHMLSDLPDTLVPPGSKMTVAFDAENAGVWPLHCHLLYYLDTGMFYGSQI
jgi:FtsP/CotA-like multicopper oxidase with cupredoxin domain